MAVNLEIDCAHAGQILGKIFQNDNLRDITLVLQQLTQKFTVHRVVMVSASKYFQVLMGPDFREGQQQEVAIPNMNGPTLKAIIDFCYTGNVYIADENIMEIVSAASATELVQIKKKCEQFWSDKLAESNCVKILLVADTYSLGDLRQKSLDFICTNFTNEAILELEFPFFAETLDCDQIPHAESEIFFQFRRWVEYDEKNRSKHAPDLSKFIRLNIIASSNLTLHVEPFAKKYNFPDVVIDEYRRRIYCDDNKHNPYRNSTNSLETIFFAVHNKNMISIVVFNPISERWKLLKSAYVVGFEERSNFGLIFANNQIIIIGGRKGPSLLHTLDRYDLDSSQQLPGGRMDNAREHFRSILLNNNIYIFGGWNGLAMRSCECISLSSMTTKTLQPMQSGRFFHSAVFFNGKVYVARGLNASSRDSCLNSVECYDPVEGNWTEIANMNHPRQLFSLVEYGGKLYAMGHHESIEWYNPATNVRTVMANTGMVNGSNIVSAIHLRNRIYVLMKTAQFGFLNEDWCFESFPKISSHCSEKIILNSNRLTLK